MADLGKAYVQIVPSAKGITGSITKVLNGEAIGAGNTAGASLGKKLASTAIKVISAAGIGKAIASSLTAGADLQQSMGGVETIFKNSADTVLANAKEAFKNAGVSANTYMEQVTSFSASLLQSLNGDTVKAAEYADRAMVAMSDNANKFGTDIQDIQNAYQGFAKENYTMLDNLKLGYGGTKTEMQRLIQEASTMTDAMDALGISVDASDMSFSNIVNAIAVVQKNMDITGTTALEAATTFSGSFGMMKAAAENFAASLTGVKDGAGDAILQVEQTLTDLLDSVNVFVFNNALPMLSSIVSTVFTTVAQYASDHIGDMTKAGVDMINGLTEGVKTSFPETLTQAATFISDFVGKLLDSSAQFLDAGTELIVSLVKGISSGIATDLPNVLGQILPKILELTESIRENAGELMDAGMELLVQLAQGIANSLPVLIEYIPQIVTNIANIINDNAPKLLKTAGQIVVTLAKGIVNAIPTLIVNLGSVAEAIVSVWQAINWVELGSGLMDLLGQGFSSAIETIKTTIWPKIQSIFEDFDIGMSIQTLWGYAKTALSWLFTTGLPYITGLLTSLLGKVVEAVVNFDWLGMITSVLTFIGETIVSLASIIIDIAGSIVGWIWNTITNTDWLQLGIDILTFIGNGILSLGEWLIGIAGDIGSWIKDTVSSVDWLQLGIDILTFIGNGILSLGEWILETVKGVADSVVTKFKETDWLQLGKDVLTTIGNGVMSMIENIKNKFHEIAEAVKEKFKETKFYQLGTSVVNKIKDGANSAKETLKTGFKMLAEGAKKAYKENGWEGVGHWIIEGIKTGISNTAGSLFNSLRNVASNALKSAKKALGINSPSKLMEDEVGEWIVPGMAVAVEADDSLNKAMEDITSNAVETAQIGFKDLSGSFSFDGFRSARVAQTAGNTENTTINQTINSAKALSPVEIARETQNMMRRLKWA